MTVTFKRAVRGTFTLLANFTLDKPGPAHKAFQLQFTLREMLHTYAYAHF